MREVCSWYFYYEQIDILGKITLRENDYQVIIIICLTYESAQGNEIICFILCSNMVDLLLQDNVFKVQRKNSYLCKML